MLDLAAASASTKQKKAAKRPETYIDPAVKYGLKLVLPRTIRRGLNFDAGYDRWEGLPTIHADYFLPIKGWTDKSLFFSPRVSLTSPKETFSVDAGFRQLITSETLLGFHAFHDWERLRRLKGKYLKETGIGLEFAALPGRYSDLSLDVNAYFPINERRIITNNGNSIVREMFPTGFDARLGFLLPAMVDHLDIRLDGELHSYRGDQADFRGYKAGILVTSRDGMWSAGFEQGREAGTGDHFKVEGTISLAFDWVEMLKWSNPFSAPYAMSVTRFNRNMRDSLCDRVRRKYDLPTDRVESRVTLATSVSNDTLSFSGAFPDLPNSRITLQTSRSPWQDHAEVITDSEGHYSGKLKLPSGLYKIRLIHKPTGRVSVIRTVAIGRPGTHEASARIR